MEKFTCYVSGYLASANYKLGAYNNIIAVLGILVSAFVAIMVLIMGQRMVKKQDESYLSAILIECGRYYQRAAAIYGELNNFGKYFKGNILEGEVGRTSEIGTDIEAIRKKLEFIKPRYGFEKMDKHYEIFDKYDQLKCKGVKRKMNMEKLESELLTMRDYLQEMGKASLALQEIFNQHPYIFFEDIMAAKDIFSDIRSLKKKNEKATLERIHKLAVQTMENLVSGGGTSDQTIEKTRREFVAQCRNLGAAFEDCKDTLKHSEAIFSEHRTKFFGMSGGGFFHEVYVWNLNP